MKVQQATNNCLQYTNIDTGDWQCTVPPWFVISHGLITLCSWCCADHCYSTPSKFHSTLGIFSGSYTTCLKTWLPKPICQQTSQLELYTCWLCWIPILGLSHIDKWIVLPYPFPSPWIEDMTTHPTWIDNFKTRAVLTHIDCFAHLHTLGPTRI